MPLRPALPDDRGRVPRRRTRTNPGASRRRPRRPRRGARRPAALGLPPLPADRGEGPGLPGHLPPAQAQDPRGARSSARAARRGPARHGSGQGVPAHEGGRLQAARGHGSRRIGHLLRRPQGRDPRPGGRVRLRQDDDAAGGPRPQGAPIRQHRGPVQGHGRDLALPAPRHAPRHPDRLPGPHGVPGPASARLRPHRRAAARQRLEKGRYRAEGRRAHGAGRARAEPRQPLRPELLRRPAPAHRHRPGPGPEPEPPGPGRTRLRPGRVHPGRRHQPARRAARHPGAELPLRRPRPVGGAPHRRPGGGDVPGQDRRDRGRRRRLRRARPPLHPGAAVRDPDPGPRQGAHALQDHPQGRPAQPRQSAVGVPVPDPLPEVRQ